MPLPARRIRARLRSGGLDGGGSDAPDGSRRGGQAARVDSVTSVLDDVEARLEESKPAVAAREVLHERRGVVDEPRRLVDERPHKEVAEGGQHDRDERKA